MRSMNIQNEWWAFKSSIGLEVEKCGNVGRCYFDIGQTCICSWLNYTVL